jgi:hypothetical protein
MTTYLGGDQVDRAQAVLDRHAVSSADGLCLECGVPGPCVAHERAGPDDGGGHDAFAEPSSGGARVYSLAQARVAHAVRVGTA